MPGASPVGRFPPAQRVRKRREFRAAQDQGRKANTPHFVLLLFARGESGPTRLGVVASRKIGSAVTRNRAKRLIREAFRATRDLFMPGIDLVVIVRKTPGALTLDSVAGEWRRIADVIDRRMVEARADLERRRAPAMERSAP